MDARTAAAATARMGTVATKRHAATVRSTTVFTMRREPVCFIVVLTLESCGPSMTPRWYGINVGCLSLPGFPAMFIANQQGALPAGASCLTMISGHRVCGRVRTPCLSRALPWAGDDLAYFLPY